MDRVIIWDLLNDIQDYIVHGQYEELYRNDYWHRMTLDEMIAVLKEYPEGYTMPPPNEIGNFTIYDISENEVSIDCHLWSSNERSEFTAIVRIKFLEGVPRYGIEDIHVL